MTTHAEFLADQLNHAVAGPAWHGDSLEELLADVTFEEASKRPIPDGHTIAELVAHIGVWAAEAERRLSGAAGYPSDRENFPATDPSSVAEWTSVVTLMRDRHASLVRAVRALDDAVLFEVLPHRAHSRAFMLNGVAQHDAYHGGQVALLKKMIRVGR